MKKPDPRIDPRRTDALYAELLARSQSWIPRWQPAGKDSDFGHALLRIAARIESEVTERLDRTPAKMALGLLDWLGITRRAGHAAKMPVVFRMTNEATESVLALKRTRLRVNAGETTVSFETIDDVRLIPSPITQLVAVDPDKDAIYYPPSEVLSLEPPIQGPSEWTVKSLASADKFTLQLTPPLGLQKDILLEVGKLEYRISADPQGDLVTVMPAIGSVNPGSGLDSVGIGVAVEAGMIVKKVSEFSPFEGVSRNLQEHILYIGDDDALNLSSPASIALKGGAALKELTWEYWGKRGDSQNPGWNILKSVKVQNERLFLKFPGQSNTTNPNSDSGGSIDSYEINGKNSRWIRARRGSSTSSSISFEQLMVEINCDPLSKDCPTVNDLKVVEKPKMEAVANTTSVVLNDSFYPFGKIPRQFDSFYLGCPEVFSKAGASTCINFTMADATLGPLTLVKMSDGFRILSVAQDGALHSYIFTQPDKPLEILKATRPDSSQKPTFTEANPSASPTLINKDGATISVAIATRNDIWLWTQQIERRTPEGSWQYWGSIGRSEGTLINKYVQLALIGDSNPELIGIAMDGSIHTCAMDKAAAIWPPQPNWRQIAGESEKPWVKVIPIQVIKNDMESNVFSDAFFVIDTNGDMFHFFRSGDDWELGNEANSIGNIGWIYSDEENLPFAPLALYRDKILIINAKYKDKDKDKVKIFKYKLEFDVDPSQINKVSEPEDIDTKGLIHGERFDFVMDGLPKIYLAHKHEDNTDIKLSWWVPTFDDDDKPILYDLVTSVSSNNSSITPRFWYTPSITANYLFAPLQGQEIGITTLSSPVSVSISHDSLSNGINSHVVIGKNDRIKISNKVLIAGESILSDGNIHIYQWEIDGIPAPGKGVRFPVDEKDNENKYKALKKDKKVIEILSPPNNIDKTKILLLEHEYKENDKPVIAIYDGKVTDWNSVDNWATLDIDIPDINHTNDDKLFCRFFEAAENQNSEFPVREEFEFSLVPIITSSELATKVKKGMLIGFSEPSTEPKYQQVLGIVNVDNEEGLVVLATAWTKEPQSNPVQLFSMKKEIDEWTIKATGDLTSNPELSWEYWNGSGWWQIKVERDETAFLKLSGNLKFDVPSDLAQTDVLGKTSYWIRARLIGGDYGRETFKTLLEKDATDPDHKQTQSVVVSTDDIYPPLVLDVRISYSICAPLFPKFLLTLDSGSWLDQSDANRTPGAIVDVFVPIAERLEQMTGSGAGTTAAKVGGEISCICESQNPDIITLAPSSLREAVCGGVGILRQDKANTGKLPLVLAKIPAAETAEVLTDTLIQAVFNLPMDSSTIDDMVYELRDENDLPVPGTVSYDAASQTATLKPISALAPSVTYRVTIRGGNQIPQIKDLAGKPLASDVTWTFTTAATSIRAIYLAFDKPLVDGPIRLLFLLEDRDHDNAAPLIVEVLRNNRFETVLATDETRALGETGFVTFTLDAPPSQSEIFGKPGFWLRLRPATAAKAEGWSPNIRGIYVNSVWAEATESQALEILGSSDGSPSQIFNLLRTPVLQHSLELRILEPLGDEEKEKLSRVAGNVKENVQGLPGRWVLWQEVTDPGDWEPTDRVYSLDPISGEICFGNGEHGMIPPIGKDSVVAFTYRCGGNSAANQIPLFEPLNLVTPIAGAESVITPDCAAGGSDAEDADTVKHFAASRLRHRDRAVTLRDLEDLSLNFSPEFVQARAFTRKEGICLMVVMGARGQSKSKTKSVDPDPSRAQARALRAYLLEHASPVLTRKGSLAVVKVDRISFRIELHLRVESLDVTGSVSDEVKTKLKRLFDPSEGGWDGQGWRIGNVPTEDDVAANLIAIEGLDGIEDIVFSHNDGRVIISQRFPIAPDQLAWLVPEGIKLRFSQITVAS